MFISDQCVFEQGSYNTLALYFWDAVPVISISQVTLDEKYLLHGSVFDIFWTFWGRILLLICLSTFDQLFLSLCL